MPENDTRWKTIAWQSPSNIALVKYWGKYGDQLPMNPSLSMTLSRSLTRLHFSYRPAGKDNPEFSFEFMDKPRPDFGDRIRRYLEKISPDLPFLKELDIRVESWNTFPHSAGIASSASSMSALALALAVLEREITGKPDEKDLMRRSSFLARRASGSACRSVFPGWVEWGSSPGLPGSSDEYAIPVTDGIHPLFMEFCDAVLIVDPAKKRVSSSTGHAVMEKHPYREARVIQAGKNLHSLLDAMQAGDFDSFASVVEQEALSLHGLMLSSDPGFFLLHPNTLAIIDKIRDRREQKGWKMCFTLDAGPNIHLLYPASEREDMRAFITGELVALCHEGRWIDDAIGQGPQNLS